MSTVQMQGILAVPVELVKVVLLAQHHVVSKLAFPANQNNSISVPAYPREVMDTLFCMTKSCFQSVMLDMEEQGHQEQAARLVQQEQRRLLLEMLLVFLVQLARALLVELQPV